MTDIIPVSDITIMLDDASTTLSLPLAAIQDKVFLASWLHGKAAKTQIAYLADMRKFYEHCQLPLRELRLTDFQDFINSLVDLKASSRARIIACVKSSLSFGVKSGYLSFNVGAVVKLPKVEDKLAERIMSEAEVAKIFALENNPRNHAILVLLYRAGLRAEELCNLTWVKLQERNAGGQVSVFGKGKKTRWVLIDDATWREVLTLKKPTDTDEEYVFQSRQTGARSAENKGKGRRLDESRIHRIVREAANRAGVRPHKVSPHWFRHAHATHSLEEGAPITLVQATLGHKSIETTAKYTHVRPDTSSSTFLKV